MAFSAISVFVFALVSAVSSFFWTRKKKERLYLTCRLLLRWQILKYQLRPASVCPRGPASHRVEIEKVFAFSSLTSSLKHEGEEFPRRHSKPSRYLSTRPPGCRLGSEGRALSEFSRTRRHADSKTAFGRVQMQFVTHTQRFQRVIS